MATATKKTSKKTTSKKTAMKKPWPATPVAAPVDQEKPGAATIKLLEPYLSKFNQVKANMERLVPGLKTDKTSVIYNALYLACERIDDLDAPRAAAAELAKKKAGRK